MKFYSKFSNHRIVLKPGIPGEPLLGRQPQAGIYVKFESGVADVKDQEVIDLLMQNRSFGKTIIAEEGEVKEDPYASQRRDTEPEHNVTNIEYGHIGKNQNPKPALAMSREQKAIVIEMAKGMAKEMAPELAKSMLLEMAAERKAAASEEAPQEVATPEEPVEEAQPEVPVTPEPKKPAAKKAPATKAKK